MKIMKLPHDFLFPISAEINSSNFTNNLILQNIKKCSNIKKIYMIMLYCNSIVILITFVLLVVVLWIHIWSSIVIPIAAPDKPLLVILDQCICIIGHGSCKVWLLMIYLK